MLALVTCATTFDFCPRGVRGAGWGLRCTEGAQSGLLSCRLGQGCWRAGRELLRLPSRPTWDESGLVAAHWAAVARSLTPSRLCWLVARGASCRGEESTEGAGPLRSRLQHKTVRLSKLASDSSMIEISQMCSNARKDRLMRTKRDFLCGGGGGIARKICQACV